MAEGTTNFPWKNVLVATGIIIGGYKLNSMLKEKAQQDVSDNLLKDVNSQVALKIYNALRPNWFTKGNTDEEALYQAAQQVKNWELVSSQYQRAFGLNLMKDLESELNSFELEQFLKIARGSSRDSKLKAEGKNPTPLGYYKFINQGTRAGTILKVGDTVTGKNVKAYVFKDISRYPLSWDRTETISGTYKITRMASYYDDADAGRNMVLLEVTGAGTKFWASHAVFNTVIKGI